MLASTSGRAVAVAAVVVATMSLVGTRITAQQVVAATICECDVAPLDALDAHIQARFKTVDNRRFGYGRIATMGLTPHVFTAETLPEDATIADLERTGLRVVMYLAGRGALSDDASVPMLLGRPPIRGPVVVTSSGGAAYPPALDLLRESRRAIEAFAGGVSSTAFEQNGWNVVAKPVRVSSDTCLACHGQPRVAARGSTLRIGDPLGAVLYAYQRIE